MRHFFKKFKQFGGLNLVKAYYDKGLLSVAVWQSLLVLFHRKSLSQADGVLRRHVSPMLREEFFPVMRRLDKQYSTQTLSHTRSNKVWFFWMQGLEEAPNVVKVCLESLKKNLADREIVVLDGSNIRDYVDLPDYINAKHEKGIITHTKFSDLLRLELLIKYGGTWIDSTVFCSDAHYPHELLDSDLFVFQRFRKGTTVFGGLSNWFVTSCTNNILLLILRDMLYEYWKRYDCDLDYFIFHLFFCMIAEYHREEVNNMPKHSNRYPLVLGSRLAEQYDALWYENLCSYTSFHKLTYRLNSKALCHGTFYDVLINDNRDE